MSTTSGGAGVLAGTAKVVDNTGQDVTDAFGRGAEQAVARARARAIRVAVLKEGSPSCGSTYTYDGTFRGIRVPAPGVTTAMLRAAGLQVFSEFELPEAERLLQQFDAERDPG